MLNLTPEQWEAWKKMADGIAVAPRELGILPDVMKDPRARRFFVRTTFLGRRRDWPVDHDIRDVLRWAANVLVEICAKRN